MVQHAACLERTMLRSVRAAARGLQIVYFRRPRTVPARPSDGACAGGAGRARSRGFGAVSIAFAVGEALAPSDLSTYSVVPRAAVAPVGYDHTET